MLKDRALAFLDSMGTDGEYDYIDSMTADVKALILETWPARAKLLKGAAWRLRSKENYRQTSRDDFRDMIYSRLQASGAYRWIGTGAGERPLAQWQYKSFVKRAGATVLEKASEAFDISRGALIGAIFSDDWRTLDELIRYHNLGEAVERALDEIQTERIDEK